MNWLSVPAGLLLAAAVIPPLVLLYFLKLRRRPQPVACTLLWKKSVEDLRANTPFQRLRRSLLLLLQLLTLALLALAIMQPQIQAARRPRGRTILMIDNSASMTATDGPDGRTRLDEAKRLARQRLETLYGRGLFSGGAGETMIIAFSDRAEIVCRFTDSKAMLLAAIDRIQPTHARTRIGEAFTLARAYLTDVDPESNEPVGDPAVLELFSDGRIADEAEQVLVGESLTWYPIGSKQPDNAAITAISIERPYDRPDSVEVFASLVNFNEFEIRTDVQLSVNATARAIEEVTIGPARPDPATGVLLPQRSNVIFSPFPQPEAAVIEVGMLRGDHLAADDAARLVVPPPRRLRVALVGGASLPLTLVLDGYEAIEPPERLDAAAYEERARAGGLEQYDVLVLDNYAPPADLMPPGRYLCFGAVPPLEGLNPYGEGEPDLILDTRQEHALFRFVDVADLYIARKTLLQPAADVQVLARGSSGPLILLVSRGLMQALVVPFHPLDSNWPFLRSFPTFIVNAVEFLGRAGEAITAASFTPGDALVARVPASATDLELRLPDGTTESPRSPDGGMFSWGPARITGVHELSWKAPGSDLAQSRPFAVNLLSEAEGEIRPPEKIFVRERAVHVAGAGGAQYMSLWPWVIGLTLVVIMLEWWIYHRKAYV